MPSDECVNLSPNVALPRYVPYDISQVLSQINIYVPIVELLRIPEHKKREFEYLGMKEENTTLGRSVNNFKTRPTIVEVKKPQVLEELGEPLEVYLGTSLVES